MWDSKIKTTIASVNELIKTISSNTENEYVQRNKKFFEIKDKKNCERIYNILNEKCKEKKQKI